jgi:hypothetical protein
VPSERALPPATETSLRRYKRRGKSSKTGLRPLRSGHEEMIRPCGLALENFVWIFLINIWEIKPAKRFFSNMPLLSHASPSGATHFHMGIDCHVNPIGPTTTFDTQNESRHFKFWVAPPLLGWLILGQNQQVWFPHHLSFFYN